MACVQRLFLGVASVLTLVVREVATTEPPLCSSRSSCQAAGQREHDLMQLLQLTTDVEHTTERTLAPVEALAVGKPTHQADTKTDNAAQMYNRADVQVRALPARGHALQLIQQDGVNKVHPIVHKENATESRAEVRRGQGPYVMATWDLVMTGCLWGIFGLYVLWSLPDFYHFACTVYGAHHTDSAAREQEANASAEKPNEAKEDTKVARVNSADLKPQSTWVILGLTIFRFSSGFENGTWLPYLLAKEGENLWGDNQALFMSVAKLIYGMVILMTPLFGLIGDRLALQSHALSRRIFVRVGVILAALGIFISHWAAPRLHFWIFVLGVFIWRLGQGFNDVTAEAICPEVLPPEQFQLASSIRGLTMMCGCLSGYVLLLVLKAVDYCWLYEAYLIALFTCGAPLILVISNKRTLSNRSSSISESSHDRKWNWLMACLDAYINPALYPGGFPMMCLGSFLFGCSSAPIFYFCLLLRDLAIIRDPVELQMHFSIVSIVFFMFAAVATVVNATLSPKKEQEQPGDSHPGASSSVPLKHGSFRIVAASCMAFGVIVFAMPFVHFFPSEAGRLAAFYTLAATQGGFFGLAYARFQDCAWQILPPTSNTANMMSFFLLTRLLGGAVGNFVAGLVLDVIHHLTTGVIGGAIGGVEIPTATSSEDSSTSYKAGGYFALCTGCSILAIFSGILTLRISSHQAILAKALMQDKVPDKEEKAPVPETTRDRAGAGEEDEGRERIEREKREVQQEDEFQPSTGGSSSEPFRR